MPSTTHGLTYPASTAVPNVPADMQTLANSIEGVLIAGGKTTIAAEESRTNTAFGLMTTPDRVQSIVVPADSLLLIGYRAAWKESVAGAATATLYVGASPVNIFPQTGTTLEALAAKIAAGGTLGRYAMLATSAGGLVSTKANFTLAPTFSAPQALAISTTDLTETETYSTAGLGGMLRVEAPAGTYDVSMQFRATSGSVSVVQRKLWVKVVPA